MRRLAIALISLTMGCDPTEQSDHPGDSEVRQESAEAAPRYGYTGALDANCAHSGRNSDGVEVFLSMCPRTSQSPDGRWKLVNFAEQPEDWGPSDEWLGGDYVFVEDAHGHRIGAVPGLSNSMPFALAWSPRPGWFFVDHHAGSFMQQVEVFEITARGVVKHEDFVETAQDAYAALFPCLDNPDGAWVNGNVQGWSPDGRRLAWIMRTRIDVCMGPEEFGSVPPDRQVFSVLLVSDLDSGQVVDGSVRIIDGETFTMPTDGPYADIGGFGANPE